MLYTTLGTYKNSFFNVQINTAQKIDTLLQSSKNIPIVIHEYLHFIQDVSSIYGLNVTSQTLSRIGHFYNIKETDISLPFHIKTDEKIFEDNDILFEAYENPSLYFSLPKENVKIKLIEKVIPKDWFESGTYIGVKYYLLKYQLQDYKKEIKFGAQALQECMARIFENSITNQLNNKSWNIPYDIPEIIIQKKYPKLLKNEYIFALCDAALMFYNPPEIFIHVLNLMKKTRFKPTGVKSIYDFVFGIVHFDTFTLSDLYKKSVDEAKKNISNIVLEPSFSFAKDWLLRTIDDYVNLRLKNPTFLCDILISGNPQTIKDAFYKLILNNISPLYFNNIYDFGVVMNKFTAANEKDKLMFWYYVNCMYEYVFETGNKNICPYKNFCSYNNSFVCQDDTNVLAKKKNDCLFDQYSRLFNLSSRNIVK